MNRPCRHDADVVLLRPSTKDECKTKFPFSLFSDHARPPLLTLQPHCDANSAPMGPGGDSQIRSGSAITSTVAGPLWARARAMASSSWSLDSTLIPRAPQLET